MNCDIYDRCTYFIIANYYRNHWSSIQYKAYISKPAPIICSRPLTGVLEMYQKMPTQRVSSLHDLKSFGKVAAIDVWLPKHHYLFVGYLSLLRCPYHVHDFFGKKKLSSIFLFAEHFLARQFKKMLDKIAKFAIY